MTFLAKADVLVKKAQTIDSKNAGLIAAESALAIARHHYRDGYTLALRAIAKDRSVPSYYALLGDAAVALSKYDQAANVYEQMLGLRRDFASWSRIATIRKLHGDRAGAKKALVHAIDVEKDPSDLAQAHVELGQLELASDLTAAQKDFLTALQLDGHSSAAHEGLGEVALAKGDNGRAEMEFKKAYSMAKLPQYAIALGDFYALEGKKEEATKYLSLAQSNFAQQEKAGLNIDIEVSLFESDHDINVADALATCSLARTNRTPACNRRMRSRGLSIKMASRSTHLPTPLRRFGWADTIPLFFTIKG
jgi:tetratricopeptide (TPR) repeat protein